MTRRSIGSRIAAAVALGLWVASAVTAEPAATSSLPWRIGNVGTIGARAGNTLYVTSVDDPAPARSVESGFAVFSTGEAVSETRITGGSTQAIASDGAGGWYVGGSFTTFGGMSRLRVAHVLASGGVDPAFVADVNGGVTALAVAGTSLVIGGSFTAVNGSPRPNLAVVNRFSGQVLAPSPAPGAQVSALAVLGSTVYVGGFFTTFSGQPSTGLGAFDVTTGIPSPTFATILSASSFVLTLAARAGALYVGGYFTTVNGIARANLAKLDPVMGLVDGTWAPNPDNYVRSLSLDGSTLYVGGDFASIAGQSRRYVAALSAATGAAIDWRPALDLPALVLTAAGGVVYVGGEQRLVQGQIRRGIAAFTAASPATLLPWNPSTGPGVYAIAAAGNRVAVGGLFGSLPRVPRSRGIVAVDLASGDLLPFDAPVNGLVRALVAEGRWLVAAGSFTQVAGAARKNLAVFDLGTGALTPLSFAMDGIVTSVAVVGNIAYLGGTFSQVGGTFRIGLAAVDLRTGTVLPWDVQADGAVEAIELVDGDIVVAGSFTSLIGTNGYKSRYGVGRITPAGAVTPFDAGVGNFVSALAHWGNTLYVAGDFQSVQGTQRNYVAAVNATSGVLLPWNHHFNNPVWWLNAGATGQLYAIGSFNMVDFQPRAGSARVAASGALDAWQPPTGVTYARLQAFADGVLSTDAGGIGFMPDDAVGGAPAAPGLPEWRASGGTLSVVWSPPVIGARPTGYLLEAGTAPGLADIATLPVTGSSFAVGGVPPGRYFVRLRSVNAAGASAASRELEVVTGAACTTTPRMPDPPVVAVAGGTVVLSWAAAAGAAPETYSLRVGTASGLGNLGEIPLGGVTALTVPGVPAGAYFLQLVPTNACGRGPASADAIARVGGAPGPPGTPIAVVGSTSTGAVSLSWLDAAGTGLPSAHLLEAGTGPGLANLGTFPLGPATSFAAGGVPPGIYYVRVRALNPLGSSPPSADVMLVVP